MIKVVRYAETIGDENFYKFIHRPCQPFQINLIKKFFYGWKCKDMNNWYRLTNQDNHILEFYADAYIIKKYKNGVTYELTIPINLNMFIEDMYRFDIQLYWSKWIDENFEPKQYLNKEEIKSYWVNLLTKMNKSFELNI